MTTLSPDTEKSGKIDEWREVVGDLCVQFAYRCKCNGRLALHTGGLSALEGAFHLLGWDDPHPFTEAECERNGCHEEATCGTPTPDGYKRLCWEHGKEFFK